MQHSFTYIATNFISATLMFALQDYPAFWHLDDISVTDTFGTQLIVNGGFETGNLSGWTYYDPNHVNSAGRVSSSILHSGLDSYEDGSINASDYLSQRFTVAPNNTYCVSFCLSDDSSSTYATYALVTITP